MSIHEMTAIITSLAGPALLWAAAYLTLARMAPLETMPGHLRQRVLRACSIAPYVAGASLAMLLGGSVANLSARM